MMGADQKGDEMAHIELGHSMITLVEPHREAVAEYNRWYEHDHAYAAVTSAPGCFAYRRFVATRPLKELRYPDPSAVADPVTKGSYIALYWYEAGRVKKPLLPNPASACAGDVGALPLCRPQTFF